jgi:hypothetical protein
VPHTYGEVLAGHRRPDGQRTSLPDSRHRHRRPARGCCSGGTSSSATSPKEGRVFDDRRLRLRQRLPGSRSTSGAACALAARPAAGRQGMSIVLLGHAQVRNFKNPDGDDYDRYMPRIDEKAGGYLLDWADVAGFCCFEEGANEAQGGRPRQGVLHRGASSSWPAPPPSTRSRDTRAREVEVERGQPVGALRLGHQRGHQPRHPRPGRLHCRRGRANRRRRARGQGGRRTPRRRSRPATDALHRFLIGLKKRPEHQAT